MRPDADYPLIRSKYWDVQMRTIDKKKILITGCGGSGTTYIARVLQAHGLDVGHEKPGRDGMVSWLCAVNAIRAPWGPSPREVRANTDLLIHQVRHPLKVISAAPMWANEEYICDHIPCSLHEPIVVRYTKFWLYWNQKAEENAILTYQIEQIDRVLDNLCALIGIEPDRKTLMDIPKNMNSHAARYIDITWDHIRRADPELCIRSQEQAARYGYSVEENGVSEVPALKKRIHELEKEVRRLNSLL